MGYRCLFLLLCFLPLELYAQSKPVDEIKRYNKLFFYSTPKTEFQNWVSNPPVFPEGYYYQFHGLIRNDTTYLYEVERPDMMLGYLIGQGVEIEDAWYKAYETRCSYSEVIVNSSLAIRVLSEKNKVFLKKHGFVQVDKPSAGCPYNVLHYSFSSKR